MTGFRAATENLKDAGCRTVYLNGGFVTNKTYPNDYDACWEEAGVDPTALDLVLLTFDAGRAAQKAKYLGELFPASVIADVMAFRSWSFSRQTRKPEAPRGSSP